MQRHKSFRFAAALLVIGIILGLVIAAGFDFTQTSQSTTAFVPKGKVVLGSQESTPKALLELQNTSDAFVYISDSVIPTVVTIQSTRLISRDDMERFHKRDDLKNFFRFKIPKEIPQRGSGSGIIVSEDGFILTNVHVVDRSEKIRVLLNNNREFAAKVVGLDPLTEVAVIKIDAKSLPVAKLGNSDNSRVGEWVLAIGNPLELQSTVTAGIISAKERQIDIIRDSYSVENFIQTDAAINPGNSGGALVNLQGEVIGVNTAIATETGYNAGFGFAIPINLAKKIMNDMIHKGSVERAFLGIAMLNMDEKKALALGLDQPKGVFVDRVIRDSPADRYGIKPRDVILVIDDENVSKSNQIQAIIARKSPEDVIHVVLFRAGREMDIDVKLQKRETSLSSFASNRSPQKFRNLGIRCESLTVERAERQNYTGLSGVVITQIERLSPADDAGMNEGDIIIEIGQHPIENKADFLKTLSAMTAGTVAIFRIIRNGEESHIFVNIPG